MKRKLKRILLFTIILTLGWNCQKEETPDANTQQDNSIKVEEGSFLDFYKQKPDFENTYNKYSKQISNDTGKSLSAKGLESYDFTIDTTKVKSVTIDGKTSYTLFIRRNEYKLEYFENLILEKDSVGQIEAYIIKYSPSESVEFFKEHGSYSFQGERTIEQLNVGRINFASRSSADCSPIVVTETWCSYDVDHPAGSGCANDGRLYTKTTSYDIGCRQPGGGVSGGNYSDSEDSSYFDDDDYKNYKRIGVKTSPITGTTKADWLMRKLRLTDPELLYFFKTDSELTKILIDFLHENNTPKSVKLAKEFAINATSLETLLSGRHTIESTNKFPSELDSCCPGDCCPDANLNDRIINEYGIKPLQAAVDGTFNLLVSTTELVGSDEWVGSRIRKIMLEIGVNVPSDINNSYLSELYRIRKRDGILIVEYKPGLLKSMLDVGLDTLDVLAFLSPGKGGGPVLLAKIGGVTTTNISRHMRDITITSIKVDNVVDNLKTKAKFVLEGTGEYNNVRGHHPLSKIAFTSDKFYDLKKAFSVSAGKLQEVWEKANPRADLINVHSKITGQQNSLYSAFAKTDEVLTIEKMANIEIKAMINVDIPEDIVTGWVVKALEDLKTQGVKVITNIPWNGLN